MRISTRVVPAVGKYVEEKSRKFPQILKMPHTSQEISDFNSLVEHYLEASRDFIPDWLHHFLHDGGGGKCVSPRLTAVTQVLVQVSMSEK